jgi:hypothetical protein
MGSSFRQRRGRYFYVAATFAAPQFQHEYIRAVVCRSGKLLLILGSTVILGSKARGTHYHILPPRTQSRHEPHRKQYFPDLYIVACLLTNNLHIVPCWFLGTETMFDCRFLAGDNSPGFYVTICSSKEQTAYINYVQTLLIIKRTVL